MPYSTADIRNVCLVGPSHAGKTLLTEALLLSLIHSSEHTRRH